MLDMVRAPFVTTQAAAITKSDVTAVEFTGLYVGGTGNVKVDIAEPRGVTGSTVTTSTVTFVGVPAGTILWINVTKVYSTDTTATSMVGLR